MRGEKDEYTEEQIRCQGFHELSYAALILSLPSVQKPICVGPEGMTVQVGLNYVLLKCKAWTTSYNAYVNTPSAARELSKPPYLGLSQTPN